MSYKDWKDSIFGFIKKKDYKRVKKFLIKHRDVPMSFSKVRRELKNIDENILLCIIMMLSEEGLLCGSKGVMWIRSTKKCIRKMMKGGLRV